LVEACELDHGSGKAIAEPPSGTTGTPLADRTGMKLLGLVDRLELGLDYHLARHGVLSANLANVDTPQYRPRDIERTDKFENALGVAMASTNSAHLPNGTSALATRVVVDEAAPANADGNAVSLDREAVKITANHVRYETISTLVAAELASLAYVAGDGKGV
jgi:flagellar basal-body rod protein FlgB